MTELKVSNMSCSHCVGAVTRAVKSIDPQADVQVDLETGRVLWFNLLSRNTGDLREPEKARETLNALLAGFPGAK